MPPHSRLLREFRQSPWAILGDVLDDLVLRANAAIAPPRPDRGITPAAISAADGRRIVVLPLFGPLTPRPGELSSFLGGTTMTDFRRAFAAAVADPNVSSIVLDVDSPGGSVSGVQEAADLVYSARDRKYVLAVADTLAASAAYWIASQASALIASPSAQLGSIGVVMVVEDTSRADTAAGIDTTVVSAGRYKALGYGPVTGEHRAMLQRSVDESYRAFTDSVARGRGVSSEQVRNGFGEGWVVSATRAVQEKMADRVETIEQVLGRLARRPSGGRLGTTSVEAARERNLRRIAIEERIDRQEGRPPRRPMTQVELLRRIEEEERIDRRAGRPVKRPA